MGVYEEVSSYIPDLGFSTSSLVSTLTVFIIFIVIGIAVAVLIWVIIMNRRFNKKIVIFEEINGKPEPVRKDRAMEMKYGEGGDTVFYWKKAKAYRPTPSIQTGRNTYWYFRRSDGEYINFGVGDLNEKMREIGAKFLDKEVRYARASMQKMLKDRGEKKGFWKEHGATIMMIIFIVVVGIMFWLSLDKFIKISNSVAGIIEKVKDVLATQNELAQTQKDILEALNNLKGSGGLVKA